MNNVREKLKTLPSKAITKILRKALVLPAPAARFFINDLTKVRKSHLPWIHKVKLDPQHQAWRGCWIGKDVRKLSKEALLQRIHDADLILFYVHGGGFRVGSSTMYMDATISWLKTLKKKYNINTMIMSIDYRLAPEHRYPSAVEDVVHAYSYLLQQVSSEKVIVVGDQAGASLLLETLLITHDPSMFEITSGGDDQQPIAPELPRPAGIIFSSPLVTDKHDSESWKTNQKYDYVTESTAKVTIKDYFEPVNEDLIDEEEQWAQRILGVLNLQTGFSEFLSNHLLMFVGHLEVFRDDVLLLASKAEQDGIHCQTVIENYVHNWFCVRELVNDKSVLQKADATFADFCARVIGKQQLVENSSHSEEDSSTAKRRSSSMQTGLSNLSLLDKSDDDDDSVTNKQGSSSSLPVS